VLVLILADNEEYSPNRSANLRSSFADPSDAGSFEQRIGEQSQEVGWMFTHFFVIPADP
jgi:hypothetical protein